jgi:hypothetical protein
VWSVMLVLQAMLGDGPYALGAWPNNSFKPKPLRGSA